MISGSFPPLHTILSTLLKRPFHPKYFQVNQTILPYQPLEISFEVEDLFAFLEAQPLYPKLYWETPKDGVTIGFGKAAELTDFPKFQSKEAPRFYGGRDFIKRKRQTWKNVPEMVYILPLIQIEKKGLKTRLRLNRLKERPCIEFALNSPFVPPTLRGPIQWVKGCPPLPIWKKNVEDILQGIHRKDFFKVVLGRCSSFKSTTALSPYALLKTLKEKNRFCFQFSPEVAFLGTSPETLYRRTNRVVETVALAGTRPRSSNPKVDELHREALLKTPKEQEEFEIVSRWIQNVLAPFCETLECGAQTILKTKSLQHLYRSFKGTLKEGITDQHLMSALHPTPALGGAPREKALAEIAKREPFDRGWYGAPVGWMCPEASHHLVGIRSALIVKNSIKLFSATGLVSGSNPLEEWKELESKIQQYKKAFCV